MCQQSFNEKRGGNCVCCLTEATSSTDMKNQHCAELVTTHEIAAFGYFTNAEGTQRDST